MKKIKTVWVIDDEEMDNFIHRKVLEMCGVPNILLFTSPEKALRALKKAKAADVPQFIFIEIYFEDVNGFDFLTKFFEIAPKPVKIFMLSASVNNADRVKARRKCSGFVAKPMIKEKMLKLFNG